MRKIILILTLIILISGCVQKTEEIPKETPRETSQEKETQSAAPAEEPVKEQEEVKEEPEPLKAPETPKAQVIEKTNWPTFHGNSERNGFSTSKAPFKANVLWKWTMDDFAKKGVDVFDVTWPIINEGKVVYAAQGIFAMDLSTGEEIWSYMEEGNFYPMGLTAGDKKIFATVNDNDNLDAISAGHVYAFEEGTGKFLWKYKTEKGIPFSMPLWADDKVFVGDNSGQVYAIDGDGKLVWKKRLEGAAVIHSSPAYENGIIFIGTEAAIGPKSIPSYVYALDAKNGDVKWKFETDVVSGKLNLIHSAPAILDGVVYVGAENGYFYAISSSDGKLVWKKKIASGSGELIGTSASAALGYGKVFIGIHEGKFLALDQKNGEVVWEFSFNAGDIDSSPVVADGKVYFGAEGGYFYCFNQADGNVIWKEKLGGVSAALANGILIVQNGLIEENLQPQSPLLIAFSDNGKLSLN